MKRRIGDLVSVDNTERKFGSAQKYLFIRVQEEDKEKSLLFTPLEIKIAEQRAQLNSEDLPKVSWLQNLVD